MLMEERPLRDEFAKAALRGLLALYDGGFPNHKEEKRLLDVAEELAKTAYVIADAMEAEANKYAG